MPCCRLLMLIFIVNWCREPSITCRLIWHFDLPKCSRQFDTQYVKVWWIYNTSDMNGRQLCLKNLQKHNRIKELSITYSYIWHVSILNTNTVHFSDNFPDIGQYCQSTKKYALKFKNSTTLGSSRLELTKLWQTKLPTDRHFLLLPDSLMIFFLKIFKNL